MIFEKQMAVGGDQRVVIFPVHLELAVGVLMVVLIGLPAQRQHGVADFRDHVIAAHQRRLVVAGLGLAYRRGRKSPRRPATIRKNSHSTPVFICIALGRGGGDHPAQHIARRLLDFLAVHHRIAGEPADFRLPGQLDQAVRIGHARTCRDRPASCPARWRSRQNRRRSSAMRVDRRGRHQLGALGAEQIGKGDQEIFDALALSRASPDRSPCSAPCLEILARESSWCPPAAPCAIAAASTVSATRSSGSRLCRWLLPQARAMVCASSVSTPR